MTSTKKRLFTALLSLFLCLSIFNLVPVTASAEGEISKVLTTISSTPVVMNGVYGITAATSTEGCYLTSYGWFNADGSPAGDTFESGNYRVEITVTPADGYYFTSDVSVYLNNSAVDYVWNGNSITLYRDYTAQVWAPSVTKSPTDEKVKEGEMASFVAIATYTTEYEWTATSPDGKTTYNCNDLPDYFKCVTIGGDGKEKMNIRNVPAELDGWTVKCKFTGPGGSAVSNSATIKVTSTATPSPSPTASPKPSASPSPSVSPTATATASAKPSADVTTSTSNSEWFSDTESHWHEDSAGNKVDVAEHNMTWTVMQAATKKSEGLEKGTCSDCGYVTERVIEATGEDSDSGFMKAVLYIMIVLIVLIVIGLVISGISQRRERKRKKKARESYHESYHDSNRYNGKH
jgi:hypothetical protein